MLKIYGLDVSNRVNKVRFVANTLGIEYELIQIFPKSEEAESDWYKDLHPARKIPAINDDGFVLFESNAIIRYLAGKAGSELYPTDVKKRAVVDQWMDFAQNHIEAAVVRVFWNTIGYKFFNEEIDERSLADGHRFLGKFLPVVDAQLGKHAYLAGDEISLADYELLAALEPTAVWNMDLSVYANLHAWRQKLQAEDFYQVDRSVGQKAIQEMMAS